MQLFYNATINEATETFTFDREESKHIIKVLRKKDEDILFVTNGLGFLFTTKIILASDSKCTVQIVSFDKATPAAFQLFLEKATEIGIQEITPILCDRSERKVINPERFEKIILSAMKQSNALYLPKLNPAISFKEFVKQKKGGLQLIAHCEETDKKTLKAVLESNTDVTLLIGPEGDFSEKEIALALEQNYTPVTLGNSRLRTETAAVVACHSVVFFNEN